MEDIYKETEVIRLTGLNRNDLKGLRETALEGKHWLRKPRNGPKHLWPIFWTKEGIEFVRSKTGIEAEVVEELKEAVVEEKPKTGVVKGKFRNQRIILCEIEDGKSKKQVNVLVRDSKNFVVGMVVPLRSDGQRWVASKHPRFGGRW
jgi:hypothetical protein